MGSRVAESLTLAALILAVFTWKSVFIAKRITLGWDAAVYLLDAHDILFRLPLYEWFRPLLFSGIVAAVWSVTGEDYLFVRYFNLAFTIASAVVLYYLARRDMGRLFAFAATLMYIISSQVLIWSDYVLVHGLTALFSILTLLAFRKYSSHRWLAGGVFAALAFLSRYTSVAMVLPIVFAYVLDFRGVRFRFVAAAILGAGVPLLAYHLAFPFVFPSFLDIYSAYGSVNAQPWFFYFLNWYSMFGIVGFVGLGILLLPSTFKSVSSRPWAFWLIGALVFFSVTLNKQERFTFEWTPAVAYLTVLGFKKIYDATINLKLPRIVTPSIPLSVRKRRTLLGAALAALILIEVVASISAYLPMQQAFGNDQGGGSLLAVAEYMKQHTERSARFISDIEAPDLAYFSGRWVDGLIWTGLGSLHNQMISENASYVIIFANVTGNSPSVLMQMGFLELKETLQTPALGQVFVFYRVG